MFGRCICMCSIKVVIIHLTRVRETFYLKEKNKIKVNSSVKLYLDENAFDLQRKGRFTHVNV